MADTSGRWEADPLFSAAEVVQDSADRMESMYRLLLHEGTLLQGDASDSKLLTSMQFHRRDLVTTLETTKWQLEDFEKAVQVATLSDQSNLKGNAVSSFKQFVQAIKELIIQVEKSLDSMPSDNLDGELQMMKSNDHDVDGLTRFLYGDYSMTHQIQCSSDSNVASRDVVTSADSDEIVEVESRDGKKNQSITPKYTNHYETNAGPHYSKASHFGSQASDFHHVYLGEMEREVLIDSPQQSDLESGTCNMKCFSARSKLRGLVFGSLRTFWFISMSKLTRSFTKRRKDGDAPYEYIEDNGWPQLPFTNFSPAQQFFVRISTLWRSLYNIEYTLLSARIRMTTLVAVALILIGFLAFQII